MKLFRWLWLDRSMAGGCTLVRHPLKKIVITGRAPQVSEALATRLDVIRRKESAS